MSDYTPNTEEIREQYTREQPPQIGTVSEKTAEFYRWHAEEVRKAKAEAWDEAYRQGIEDERTAEELKVDIGVGGYATANRTNPYRDEEDQ